MFTYDASKTIQSEYIWSNFGIKANSYLFSTTTVTVPTSRVTSYQYQRTHLAYRNIIVQRIHLYPSHIQVLSNRYKINTRSYGLLCYRYNFPCATDTKILSLSLSSLSLYFPLSFQASLSVFRLIIFFCII